MYYNKKWLIELLVFLVEWNMTWHVFVRFKRTAMAFLKSAFQGKASFLVIFSEVSRNTERPGNYLWGVFVSAHKSWPSSGFTDLFYNAIPACPLVLGDCPQRQNIHNHLIIKLRWALIYSTLLLPWTASNALNKSKRTPSLLLFIKACCGEMTPDLWRLISTWALQGRYRRWREDLMETIWLLLTDKQKHTPGIT